MADTITLNSGTGGATLGTDEVTIGGTLQHVQRVKLVDGADGGTGLIGGDATNGLDVDVTRLPALVANSGVDVGDVTVNNVAGSPVPVQQSDGSAAQTFATADLDSGAGTVTRILTGIALPASGGPVAGGTSTNPVRTDPTGTTTQPVSGTVTANLGTLNGAATEATLDARTGALTETAPASDTGSSGLNGRLQRIAQRITSLIALLPTSLGQKAMSASLAVALASDQSAIPASQSGTWTVQPGNTANTTPWLASLRPGTSGGLSVSHIVSAASTNATNIKASAGQVFGWYIYNANAAARKVTFHNTSGTPTAGASVFFSIVIPPASAANVFSDTGIAFSTGIAVTMVTGVADSDATAVAANDLVCNIFYA